MPNISPPPDCAAWPPTTSAAGTPICGKPTRSSPTPSLCVLRLRQRSQDLPGRAPRLPIGVTTMTGTGRKVERTRFAFLTRHPADVPSRRFELAADEVLAMNPNTGTLPMFRTRVDADITLGIYRRHPILIRDGDPAVNPWGLTFGTLFHMANDSGLFHQPEDFSDDEFNGLVLPSRRQGIRAPLRGKDAQPLRPPLLHLPRRHPSTAQCRCASPDSLTPIMTIPTLNRSRGIGSTARKSPPGSKTDGTATGFSAGVASPKPNKCAPSSLQSCRLRARGIVSSWRSLPMQLTGPCFMPHGRAWRSILWPGRS